MDTVKHRCSCPESVREESAAQDFWSSEWCFFFNKNVDFYEPWNNGGATILFVSKKCIHLIPTIFGLHTLKRRGSSVFFKNKKIALLPVSKMPYKIVYNFFGGTVGEKGLMSSGSACSAISLEWTKTLLWKEYCIQWSAIVGNHRRQGRAQTRWKD